MAPIVRMLAAAAVAAAGAAIAAAPGQAWGARPAYAQPGVLVARGVRQAPQHVVRPGRHRARRPPLAAAPQRPVLQAWPYDRALALALAAAHTYWRQAPACGTVGLVRVSAPPVDPAADVQPGSWAYVLPDGLQTCSIYLVARDWTVAAVANDYPQFCRLVAHEYAHLLGMWDVEAAGQMLSHTVDGSLPDPACDRAAASLPPAVWSDQPRTRT